MLLEVFLFGLDLGGTATDAISFRAAAAAAAGDGVTLAHLHVEAYLAC